MTSAVNQDTKPIISDVSINSLRPSPNQFKLPEITSRLSFSSETVRRLTFDDFDTTSKELIGLKYDDCILILFYVENTESYQLATIWSLVAQQVAGPIFAAINMLSERKLAEAFTRLKSDGSHPLHWAALRQYPYILVYRKRWPVAVYNGPRDVQALIDYSLTLACEAGYYEVLQLGGSMQGEQNAEMSPYDIYTNIPGNPPKIRRESLQYNASNPIRGFNPDMPINITTTTKSTPIPTTNPTTIPTTNSTTIPTTNSTTNPTTIPTPNSTTNPTTIPTTNPTTNPTTSPIPNPIPNPITSSTTNSTTSPIPNPTTNADQESVIGEPVPQTNVPGPGPVENPEIAVPA